MKTRNRAKKADIAPDRVVFTPAYRPSGCINRFEERQEKRENAKKRKSFGQYNIHPPSEAPYVPKKMHKVKGWQRDSRGRVVVK